RRESLPPRGQQALDLLGQDLHRFQRLVEDLLEIGRLDLAAPESSVEPVRIAEFVLRVAREQLPPEVPVQVEAAAMDVGVRADKRRLERVLVNLFDNAARHAGGVSAFEVVAAGGWVRITVEDRGPGIPATDRERVFERFARLAPARDRTDGAGLGLALAREHVAAHHGRIWVEEASGGGARFVVMLPVADE
ncbi:MAG: sensor histidine kinase, partial [Mycobacteriales bacterium]